MQPWANPAHLERLRVAANLGGGQASRALSQVIGDHRLELDVPLVGLAGGPTLAQRLGGSRARVAAVQQRLLGTTAGDLLLLLPEASALALAEILLRTGEQGDFDADARSALTETGGLLAVALLTSLSRTAGISLLPDAPRFVRTQVGELLPDRHRSGLLLLIRFSDRRASGRGAEPLRTFFGHFVVLPGEILLQQAAEQATL